MVEVKLVRSERAGVIHTFTLHSIKTDYIMESRNVSISISKALEGYNEYMLHASIDYLAPRKFRKRFMNNQ